jgi:hypothetical protein
MLEMINEEILTASRYTILCILGLALSCGEKSEPLGPECSGSLSGFKFGPIEATQESFIPFSVDIEAQDECGKLIDDFSGVAQLQDVTGTLNPDSAIFNSGQWSGELTVSQSIPVDSIVLIYNGVVASSNTFSVDPSPSEGWDFFEHGLYEEAISLFSELLDHNPDLADAFNGRGWSYLELRRLNDAKSDFNSSIQLATNQGLGQVANEARTGLGSTLNATGEYTDAVQPLRAVIDDDPSFCFGHRTSIDIIDVRLVLSIVLLGVAKDEANSDVVDSYFDEIAENLNAIDTENPIYRNDPSTWRVGNERFNSFEGAVLEKLEWLISIYWG